MAVVHVLALNPNCHKQPFSPIPQNPNINPSKFISIQKLSSSVSSVHIKSNRRYRHSIQICNAFDNEESNQNAAQGESEAEVDNVGVKAALSMLRFYKREISPLMPNSCRYVPTCSEYSMQAYKKYGVAKGTILTAWRLCRCNPIGGSGFDPPRWFDEQSPPED